MRTMILTVLTVLIGALALPACVPQVSAGCDSDADCAVRCETTERDHFPGGLCTLTCNRNDDCPPGTWCIDIEDGLCMQACSSMAECDDFGPGYYCKDRKDVHGELQLVCMGD